MSHRKASLNPFDYLLSTSLGSYIFVRNSTRAWPFTTISTSTHRVVKPLYDDPPIKNLEEETIFPSLPPLFFGHPDIHIRNGIMAALRMDASQVPDAEKAFFVADLSQIYRQHKRWKACLPEVKPFYGGLYFLFLWVLIIQICPVSCQMQPGSVYYSLARCLGGWFRLCL